MTATFHAKRMESTKARSMREEMSTTHMRTIYIIIKLTKVFWKEDHADCVDEEGDNFGDNHVYMPTR